MATQASMRNCTMCKRLTFDLGDRHYSDVTPGGPGYVACDHTGAFSLDCYSTTDKFRAAMRTAETCDSFAPVMFDDSGNVVPEEE